MDPGTETLFSDPDGFSGPVTVQQVIFTAPDDGYAVVEVRDRDGDEFVATGPLAHLQPGERARLIGQWQDHHSYGRQLRAEVALPLDPDNREGRVAYLSSLRNIGKVRAEALCDLYGAEVLDRIAADPEGTFGSLPGMGPRRVESAVSSWYETRSVRDLHIELGPHGLAHLAGRIAARFGDQAIAVLRNDPYRLTEVDGVGFQRADAIAQGVGIPADSESRAEAAARFLLGKAEQHGHTHLELGQLQNQAERLLELPAEPEVLAGASGLAREDDRVYRRITLERERLVASELRERATAEPSLDISPDPEGARDLTAEQWQAVLAAFTARVSVITGGPGVGKTVCTRAIVEAARAARLRIGLCAPTGRAARRLGEATGSEAHTIHRLLEWRPGSEPAYRPGHPLPLELLVVDEASMINLHMAEVLISGLGSDTHLVLVGDADQLPPVGAGKPFADLLDSGLAPATRLTHVFRQAARSMIITAAHEINRGRPPHLEPEEGQRHDFHFLERESSAQVRDAVVEMVAERVRSGLGLDPVREAQVLAPIYRSEAGIDALNRVLQKRLNPNGRPAVRDRFRVGDRLIQTRNAYELNLMNGTICFLVDDDPDEEMAVLETDDGQEVTVTWDEAADLRLAYAISVHKSQGSEIPVVIFVCHRSHSGMLTRPLIYTAVTRAREMCVVVGDRPALLNGVRRDEAGTRNSSLARRLRGEIEA